MTSLLTTNLLRVLFVIFAISVGSAVGESLFDAPMLGLMVGALFGLSMVLVDRLLRGFSLRAFSSATFGLLLGLIAARLLLSSDVLKYLDEGYQWAASLVAYTVFAYLGMMLAMRSNRDEFSLIIPYVRFSRESIQDSPILVDTNILIDGRIEALAKSGIISGSIVVANFILDELQRLADSKDPLKRERGRRGLDNVAELQSSKSVEVSLHDTLVDAHAPADQRLLQLARLLQARVLSNDSAFCKVARLQNVRVINLVEVAASLRPALSAGQSIEIRLAKPGKDPHQAVGYLDDGTMIVVNNAIDHLDRTVEVTIAGTVRTSAGRMFFADLSDKA